VSSTEFKAFGENVRLGLDPNESNPSNLDELGNEHETSSAKFL